MTKLSFSIKSILFTTIVALSLLLGSNVWAFANVFNNIASADSSSSSSIVTSNVTSIERVTTYDFESATGTLPATPTQFEAVSDENNVLTPEKSGVISLKPGVYNATNYKLDGYATSPQQRSTSSEKVLMINGYKTDLYYGYQAKTATTLNANSFYEIKLYAYTDNNAIASVYLSGDGFDDNVNSKITSINTNSSWQEVVFYVATSQTKSANVKVQLYLGKKTHTDHTVAQTSSNFVLFDDVTISRISGTKYAQSIASTVEYQSVVDLDDSTRIQSSEAGFIANGSFTNSLTDWTIEDNSSASGVIQHVSNLDQAISINGNQVILNTHQSADAVTAKQGVVLSVQNGASASLKSADITIKPHQIYRISLWAKGVLNSSTLAITLSGILDNGTEDGLTLSKSITAFDATAESINAEWGLYEFYVVGNPLTNTTINLTLGITSQNSTDSGYLAVSDISSYLVTSAQMTAGTSNNSSAQTLKMFSTDNTLAFANYSFNLVSIDTINASNPAYPLVPESWTTSNNKNTNSGVVNISYSAWSNGPFKTAYRPTKANLSGYSDNDNVLMINGASGQYQEFTSDTQPLSADGYAKITFQANVNTTSDAYVIVKNSNGTILAKITLNKNDTYQEWKNYSIYLHNYLNEQTISVTLALGSSGKSVDGAVYFDNVKFDSSIDSSAFDDAVANSTTFIYDLNKNALSSTVSATDNTPLMWNLTTVQNANEAPINGGIIDYRNAVSNYTYINKEPGNPEGNDSNKIMVIQAGQPVYTAYNSTLTYSFTENTYYKLSVWVKTTDLTPDTVTADDYTEDGRLIVHGASIILTNIDSSFTSINTQNSQGVDEWMEYVFYIYPTQATTSNIQLGLGCSDMPTAGYAYFANLNITSLSEDEYNNEILSYDVDNLPSNVLLASNVPTEDEENTNTGLRGNFDPFAFSTIIIAVAILVAIVGVVIKKIRQNAPKKAKKVSNSYDRLNTLLKDVDRRERKTAINHKIKLLKEELAQSQNFLAEEVSELKKQTESYNTAKEIAKDNPTIELCAPDVKQIQKEIDIQTAKINQIEEDIEILEAEKARIEKQSKSAIKKLDVNKNTKIK